MNSTAQISNNQTIIVNKIVDYLCNELLEVEIYSGRLDLLIFQKLIKLIPAILTRLLHRYSQKLPNKIQCAVCGEYATYRRKRTGVLFTLYGKSSYERPCYCGCACKKGVYPYDRLLQLVPGQYTVSAKEILSYFAGQQSFANAVQHCERVYGVPISANTARKAALEAGSELMEKEQVLRKDSQDETYLQELERNQLHQAVPAVIYASLDGAHIPLKNRTWQEGRVICWYQVNPKTQKAEQIQRYFSNEAHTGVGELLWATGTQAKANVANKVVVLSDAATWIATEVEKWYLPKQRVHIIDYYHAQQYFFELASHLPDTVKKEWQTTVSTLLWEAKLEELRKNCIRLAKEHGLETEVATKLNYLAEHSCKLQYPTFLKLGYPIGSGTVESSCKQIVSNRLRLPGARWLSENALLIGKLRAFQISASPPI